MSLIAREHNWQTQRKWRCTSGFVCGFAFARLDEVRLLAGAVTRPHRLTLGADANFGPYNVSFLEGGVGLARPLSEEAAAARAGAPWTISGWLRSARRQSGAVIVAAVGGARAAGMG